jgi:surface protein
MFTFNYGLLSSQFRQPFIFIIQTDSSFTIPTRYTSYAYNYNIDWIETSAPNDPPIENPISGSVINQTEDCELILTGKSAYYQISISGLFPTICFRESLDQEKLRDIVQWGDNVWTTMRQSFSSCSNLGTITATDTPNLSEVTDCLSMFNGCLNFDGDLSNWKTGNVTDMSGMFESCVLFNSNIMNWDTSSVTSMEAMFRGAASFNQEIGIWDVSNVTEMSSMFESASSFDQSLKNWCVTNILSAPSDFDLNATSWVKERPDWGNCPP